MAFERYEQIISLQDITNFASVSKGTLSSQNTKQFDTKYELLATIWQKIHYNQLFSTEDGSLRTDIPAHALSSLKKSLIHIYFYTDVTIELWDTLKLEGSTDLDGGRTQLNTWDPDNLFDALPLITKELIEGAGVRDAIATGDFKSLIESDPTEFVSQEEFLLVVEQVVKNTEDIKNLALGNVRTGLIPTESSAESWLETENASQETINVENALALKTLRADTDILEDAINNKLLRTSRSIDYEPISILAATSYVIGFTDYTSDYFDSTGVIVNPGTANERTEYRVFTLKEGLSLKKDVPVDLPINLDFGLTGAANNESGKIRIWINGSPTIIGDFKIEGTVTTSVNFYKVFRITPTEDLTDLEFYIDAVVENGGFTATLKSTSYIEVQIETVIGVPNDIFNAIYPIGSIYIGTTAPSKGTWNNLGTLEDGQSIIGGVSSNGEIKRHNHLMFGGSPSTGNIETDLTADDYVSMRTTFGGDLQYEMRPSSDTPARGKTKSTGGDYNKAWGIGIGSKSVWERTA